MPRIFPCPHGQSHRLVRQISFSGRISPKMKVLTLRKVTVLRPDFYSYLVDISGIGAEWGVRTLWRRPYEGFTARPAIRHKSAIKRSTLQNADHTVANCSRIGFHNSLKNELRASENDSTIISNSQDIPLPNHPGARCRNQK